MSAMRRRLRGAATAQLDAVADLGPEAAVRVRAVLPALALELEVVVVHVAALSATIVSTQAR